MLNLFYYNYLSYPVLEELDGIKIYSKKYIPSVITTELNFQYKRNLFGLNTTNLEKTVVMNLIEDELELKEVYSLCDVENSINL